MCDVRAEELLQALAAGTPGREGEWAVHVSAALADLERELWQHAAAAAGPDSLYATIDLTRPTLMRRAGQLRRQHLTFLEQAQALRRETDRVRQAFRPYDSLTGRADILPDAPAVGAVPDLGNLRQRVEQFLTTLERHTHAEADLVVETVTTDIGVGD